MKKSVRNRIKITSAGKIIRRRMGLSHFKAKKSNVQKLRLKKNQTLDRGDLRNIKKYF